MANKNYSENDIFESNPFVRMRAEREKRRRVVRNVLLAVTAVVAVAAIAVFLRAVCKISEIEVSGESGYTYEEIVEASGLEKGTSLFSVNKKNVSQNVKEKLPALSGVKVRLLFPVKVRLEVSQVHPRYSFGLRGESYYLSEDFYCMGKDVFIDETDDEMIYKLDGGIVKSAIAGHDVELIDDDWRRLLKMLTDAADMSGIGTSVTLIETKDKFDMVLVYEDRIKIRVGDYKNLEEKLTLASEIIKTLSSTESGTIRVRSYKEGSFARGEYN